MPAVSPTGILTPRRAAHPSGPARSDGVLSAAVRRCCGVWTEESLLGSLLLLLAVLKQQARVAQRLPKGSGVAAKIELFFSARHGDVGDVCFFFIELERRPAGAVLTSANNP